jgi:hypothetical protein
MLDSVDGLGLDRDDFNRHLVSYYETGTDSSAVKYGFSIQGDCDVCETVRPTGRITRADQSDRGCAELRSNGRAFFERLETVDNQIVNSADITAETQDRLEDLGYI